MSTNAHTLQINWSVWDRNPTVSWIYDGILAAVNMKLPPIAVSHLSERGLIAIVGDFDEFGSANLFMYACDGSLCQRITAPALGENAQFGSVIEINGDLQATVGFRFDSGWKEEVGQLTLDDGPVIHLRRTY